MNKYHVWNESKTGKFVVSRTVVGTNNECAIAECHDEKDANEIAKHFNAKRIWDKVKAKRENKTK